MIPKRALASGVLLSLSAFVAAPQASGVDRERMRLLARPAQVLLPEELRGNCAGLTVTIKTHIDRLRELLKKAQKEDSGPWPTLFGDRPDKEAYLEERGRVEALNVVLAFKGCHLVDIEDQRKMKPPEDKDNMHPPRGSMTFIR